MQQQGQGWRGVWVGNTIRRCTVCSSTQENCNEDRTRKLHGEEEQSHIKNNNNTKNILSGEGQRTMQKNTKSRYYVITSIFQF